MSQQQFAESDCQYGATTVPLRQLFEVRKQAQKSRDSSSGGGGGGGGELGRLRFVEPLMFRGLPFRVISATTGELEIVTAIFEAELVTSDSPRE